MKKILTLTIIGSLLVSCQSVVQNENILSSNRINSTSNNLKNIVSEYYPLEVGTTWKYSLEQFQNDTQVNKFTKMEISVISNEKKDHYFQGVLNRFYPESNVQPYKTLAKQFSDRIELSRYMQKEVFKEFSKAGSDYITVLMSPLEKDKNWEGRVFQGGTETIKVLGNEDIKVPFGNFSALKINHQLKYNNGKEDNLYYWYVKNIGVVKMYEEITMIYSSGESVKFKSIGYLNDFSKKSL